jgi:DNA-binding transcriptional LysR family regulator
MNIHHLELFYYVARHGGISEAVRNMPYGIQQPAVSGQIIQLEDFLGVTLFHRRPFALTQEGQDLYQFIRPFFENLNAMAEKLRGGVSQRIRIGASEIVLRDHLPGILQTVRKQFPKLKVTLREGYQPDLEAWLQKRELDLAVTLLPPKTPAGLQSVALLKLPLILLVAKDSPVRAAGDLWKRDRIEDTLISLPATEAICKQFQQGLGRLGVDWFTGIEVSSVELIETYVQSGYGIGLSVAVPKARPSQHLRVLPLPDFPPVNLGMLWQGRETPLLKGILEEMKRRAQSLEQ